MADDSHTEAQALQPQSVDSAPPPFASESEQLFPDKPLFDTELQLEQLTSTLPTEKGWYGQVFLYENYWCPKKLLSSIFSMRSHFTAQDSDIILASRAKSGTTWLKALAFSTLLRSRYHPTDHDHPLLSSNPHELAPFLEFILYADPKRLPDLSNFTVPRLFATHVPYELLPESVHRSNCRMIYICRNPLDTLVSLWHFMFKAGPESRTGEWSMEEMFDYTCRGIEVFGPFWANILGYWKASLERPDKVLFLKYEDLKEDTAGNLKKIADFMRVPFSEDEKKGGMVEEIIKLCSLSKLKELEVNKTGSHCNFEHKTFFRRGEVGDWVNHLSPPMVERLQGIMEERLSPFGLTFKVR